MKTNNVMLRPMGQFQVEQRTKDGMFNATALLNQWNESSGQQKQMAHYFDNNATEEFIKALMSEEELKERNSVYLKSRGKSGGTWMHPLMFIDFAMWLNPAFKVKVLKFVYDQMIKYRNDAGDAYRELGSSVGIIVSKSFMAAAMSNISKGINYVVFGEHYTAVRNNKGTESLQRELFEMERKVSELIRDGFLKSYEDVMNYLRKKWREKYIPSLLK